MPIIIWLIAINIFLIDLILITAFIKGGTSKPEPKQSEIPNELKRLHDKFIGRR